MTEEITAIPTEEGIYSMILNYWGSSDRDLGRVRGLAMWIRYDLSTWEDWDSPEKFADLIIKHINDQERGFGSFEEKLLNCVFHALTHLLSGNAFMQKASQIYPERLKMSLETVEC